MLTFGYENYPSRLVQIDDTEAAATPISLQDARFAVSESQHPLLIAHPAAPLMRHYRVPQT